MWKFVGASVRGTSHIRTETACQDFFRVEQTHTHAGDYLIVTCADGAGSANFSEIGARVACERACEASKALLDERPAELLARADLIAVFRAAQQAIVDAAVFHQKPLRDLATTLILAIAGESQTVFAQIGDGASVYVVDGTYHIGCWPQTGEYANVTTFVSHCDLEQSLVFHSCGRIDRLAVFTDGLQLLALDVAKREAYAPFFHSMFEHLHRVDCAESLQEPLSRFLESKPVNDRTDDDKTLVLITRGETNE